MQCLALFLMLIAWMSVGVIAQERTLRLASTTSTEQSGFFDHVLPLFEAEKDIHVNVIAVGNRQALKIGERGDAWHEWITGPLGRKAIVDFKIDGEQVFFPPDAQLSN